VFPEVDRLHGFVPCEPTTCMMMAAPGSNAHADCHWMQSNGFPCSAPRRYHHEELVKATPAQIEAGRF
jgi:hypothetical protein